MVLPDSVVYKKRPRENVEKQNFIDFFLFSVLIYFDIYILLLLLLLLLPGIVSPANDSCNDVIVDEESIDFLFCVLLMLRREAVWGAAVKREKYHRDEYYRRPKRSKKSGIVPCPCNTRASCLLPVSHRSFDRSPNRRRESRRSRAQW